jgi:ADP-L-glycero-D-manno-heptose 6-epimerase
MALSSKGNILVTGGAGFIGSALVWALNETGYENVVVCDRLGTDEKWKNLVPLSFADYVDADDLLAGVSRSPNFLGDIDAVFHLGACSATTERDAGFLMRNNFEYTKTLAGWALARRARFIYASSAATYGDGSAGMRDGGEDLSSFRPLNMYGYSKHLFDQYAQRKGIARSMVGLKYFNIFGPNEDHKGDMRSVVHKAFAQIEQSGKVQLFKSYRADYAHGEQQRDFLYVKDAVTMTLHLANQPLAGGLFNIGSGVPSTWIQLAEAIFAALGRAPDIEFVEMPEALREKYQYYTCADISRLRSSGYGATPTALRDAVADYVLNYLAPNRTLGG